MKHVKNAHMGTHLLVEVYNVPFEKLNDAQKIEEKCVGACKTENLQVLNTYTHHFDPYGVTCTVTLGESHLACHTWPEKGCMSADFYTCGEKDPKIAAKYIIDNLYSEDYRVRVVKR